jgi:HK97 family phage prohead protease
MKNQIKHVTMPLELKAGGPEGSVQACFSTFGIVDKDSDVVLASAFTEGQAVPMCWGHEWNQPVGRGIIHVQPDRAIFDGQFFLETQAGQEAYKTVKAMGDLQEYSWGFSVLDSSYETRDGQPVRVIKQAKVYEVSPVLVGAGENTGTLAIKAVDFNTVQATAQAQEDLWDLRWEMQSALRESVGSILEDDMLDTPTKLAMIRTSCAQYADALVGWANQALALVSQGIDVELDGLDDRDHKGLTLKEHSEAALAAAKDVVSRFAVLATNLTKEGRAISQTRLDRMGTVRDMMRQMADELDAMMTEANPPAKATLPIDYLERRLRASALSLATLN